MAPFYVKSRPLILALSLTLVASGAGYAEPLSVHRELSKGACLPLHAPHYRRAILTRVSPWQAPYHTSRWYRGGPGAEMGLVAQGIIPPPRYPRYFYPVNNYFYYPNYRDIYAF